MIKIGMIIGDRYEIQEKIGTGGTADVYRALDRKLNRPVAMKVLKQEFSENDNFVSKFRSEAQSAAGLMHPNIVNVYDVGNEKGIYYIVMELVDGITLKKYIEKKSRLTVKEAVSIAIQVAMGLEAAHNNHIIHRDIKPQNIIISKDGKVKMTDFGIAKAASSNTITSNVMGSVHYTSPEQARGGYSDAKSDIYSLGVTLFEMLTGRVPFNGDTTVAIAIMHIQEPLPSPREFVPDLPISVEKIVLKCCQKSPDRRYQSAALLIADLKRSLITPDEDFVQLIDPDEDGATRIASEGERQMIKHGSTGKISQTEQMRLNRDIPREESRERRRFLDEDEAEEDTRRRREDNRREESRRDRKENRYEDPYDEEEEDDYQDAPENSRMERVTVVIAVIAALLVGVIIIYMAGRGFGVFGNSGSSSSGNVSASAGSGQSGITVPSVIGQSYAEAVSNLEAKGFRVEKKEDSESLEAKNTVVAQSPEGNQKAQSADTITLTVSTGANAAAAGSAASASSQEQVAVPNVIGMDEETATLTLIEAGLKVGSVTEVSNADANLNGLICNQTPTVGTKITKGSTVSLELSTGPAASVTYSYSANIEAPTAAEDSSYVSGTTVQVALVSSDGTQLLNTSTTSFPITVNYTGIKSPTGVLKMVYAVTTPTVTDPATGTTTGGTTATHTVTRAITFTQAQ
ncbi:MAG: Stk1 family PASTA domain-containing Ser/Thr kinase [Butyrivibrio sp.]|nr:Stk1 family PASTA domain-containing Ser/Thr kinase [Butyrivibrio sp.]